MCYTGREEIWQSTEDNSDSRGNMKVLNLYAGIGGNRTLWGEEHQITAVEINSEIAGIYKSKFPNDNIIVTDAHYYLLEHYKEFDFIWSSPPCPSHSKLCYSQNTKQYIDVALYHRPTRRVKIIDIKTSTMGWNKYQKKNKIKTSQLLLYKQFFSKQRDCAIDNIDIEYFIVKRKLYKNMEFPQKRIQTFVPANGKVRMNKIVKDLQQFFDNAFDKNGNYKEDQIATPSKSSCKYCEFNQTEYCDKGIA